MADPKLPAHDRSKWNKVLAELQACIRRFRKNSATGDVPDGLMFRGQRSSNCPLIPSLFRHENAFKNESNLFTVFSNKAGHLLERPANEWEMLSQMQHFGVPTRLLDWSDSFGPALFFAVRTQKLYEPEDAAVWVMNGFALSRKLCGESAIFNAADLPPYAECFTEPLGIPGKAPTAAVPWPFKMPAPVEAAWSHRRIVAQRGLFTIHGTDRKPLEKQFGDPDCLVKLVIPKEAILHARQWLRLAGIDHYTIFPDLEGLAETLKDEYCDKNLKIYQRISSL